jgi:predicted tellurium resistance membrane protein TerC
MAEFFSLDTLFTLAMLVLLQAVLGFDNLLYIALESQRVAPEQQARVRHLGIIIALILRIILLLGLTQAVKYFQEPFFSVNLPNLFEITLNFHSLIVLIGGVFIIYTAIKEIFHLLSVEDLGDAGDTSHLRSVATAVTWIVAMNAVFSFDSILSAMALTDNFWIMAIAVVISGILMLWLADHVADFLQKNRMYEVLGLFILFIVGILLLSDGGSLAQLAFFGYPIEPMAKSTFYFVIGVLIIVDIIQGRYQKKLDLVRKRGG